MRFERRFTTADQSPYATIEFRATKSEIKNPDGSEYVGQVWPGYTVCMVPSYTGSALICSLGLPGLVRKQHSDVLGRSVQELVAARRQLLGYLA